MDGTKLLVVHRHVDHADSFSSLNRINLLTVMTHDCHTILIHYVNTLLKIKINIFEDYPKFFDDPCKLLCLFLFQYVRNKIKQHDGCNNRRLIPTFSLREISMGFQQIKSVLVRL